MKNIFTKSRGQVAFPHAGIIAAVLGAVALGADVSMMYVNWQQVQKTDAAVLAGANYLGGYVFEGTAAYGCTGQPDYATEVACTYAVDNGLSAANLTITEPTSSTIQVVAQETGLPYFFGKVLGLNSYNVSATAIAHAAGQSGTVTDNLFPVGLQCTNPCSLSSLDPGQSVSFGSKFVGGLAPGNWQFLDISGGHGGGDTLLEEGLAGDALAATFTLGGTIVSEPGNKGNSGPVKSALTSRLSRCESISDPCTSAGGNPHNIPAGDPCLVVVPAVDFHGCAGGCSLTIEGFAMVYLEPATTTTTSINGCFVNAVAASSIANSSAPTLGAVQPPTLSQ